MKIMMMIYLKEKIRKNKKMTRKAQKTPTFTIVMKIMLMIKITRLKKGNSKKNRIKKSKNKMMKMMMI